MSEVDLLSELMSRCKCGVHITINEHLNYYMTAAETLTEYADRECPPEIADDVRAVIIESNTIVNVHFYPDTPIGFYEIYHHDLKEALKDALNCLEQRR